MARPLNTLLFPALVPVAALTHANFVRTFALSQLRGAATALALACAVYGGLLASGCGGPSDQEPTARIITTPQTTPTPTATLKDAPTRGRALTAGTALSATDTSTPAPSATAAPAATPTATASATPSPVPTATATATPAPTPAPSPTPQPTPTPSPTATATATPTPTPSPAATATATPATPSPTPPGRHTLTASVSPFFSGGRVTLDPGPNFEGRYAAGTVVTLTASPSARYRCRPTPYWSFDRWAGDIRGSNPIITITVDSDINAIAVFDELFPPKCATPTVSVSPAPKDTPTPTYTPTPKEAPAPTYTPTPTPGQPDVQIACVFFDGVISRQEPDEYVEIVNLGNEKQDLEGWSLIDISDGSPTFQFPPWVLEPGDAVRVYTNQVKPEWGGFSFGHGSAVWNNSDPDTAGLYDRAGDLVSTQTYPPGCE